MFNTNEKWYSLPVMTYNGRLEELIKYLPEFRIHPFWGNEYLNVVARQPIGEDNQTIPVATVSKKYALIQHTDVIKSLKEGLDYAGLNTEQLTAKLKLSIYGERMHLIVKIPNYDFDPGDGNEIVMNVDCFNSVDKSCALQIGISWTRLVCTNGMMEEKKSSIRKIHNVDWMNKKNISDFLKKKFESAPGIYSAYKEWMNTKIEISEVEEWIEKELLEKWKSVNSLRALNIMKTGRSLSIL